MARLHTKYSYVVTFLLGYMSGELTDDVQTRDLRGNEQQFQKVLKPSLDENCKPGLSRLEFYLCDHVIDDLECCGCLKDIDTWTFERNTGILSDFSNPHLTDKACKW